MKKIRYALLMLALLAPAALLSQESSPAENQQASGPRGRHMRNVDQQLTRLSKRLRLTDEQKPQVKAILQDQNDQMQQLWQNSPGSRAENRQKMRDIHQTASDKLRALLTDDQKAKYDKMEAKREEHVERHRGGEGASQPPATQPQQ